MLEKKLTCRLLVMLAPDIPNICLQNNNQNKITKSLIGPFSPLCNIFDFLIKYEITINSNNSGLEK